MSVLSNFEGKVEGAVDGAAAAMFSSPIEPAQIAKKAEKQMKKEKLVGSGRQYAPTLYNVMVNTRDDKRLFGFYPTMASEIENYLYAKGTDAGMEFDTRPLVRFIPDQGLKKGRFDVIAEVIAAPIIKKLREEELEYYGLASQDSAGKRGGEALAADANARSSADRSPASKAGVASSRFAGLDVPAHIEDSMSSSGLPSLRKGAAASGLTDLSSDAARSSSQLPSLTPETPDAVAGLPSLTPKTPDAVLGISAAETGIPGAAAEKPGHANETPGALQDKKPQSQTAYVQDDQASSSSALGQAALYNSTDQRVHRLGRRKLTAGRGSENDIVVPDVNASRVHARFSQDATGKWKLTDLDSTNGTLLNGRPVGSAILKSGDEITIGTSVLQFRE